VSTPNPATTPWVPLWNLNGAAGMNYKGAYVTATNYADGDIVVYNGIAYLCVRPTTNPPAAWPMAPGISQYATSLPTSPYDGQTVILVDSITNPTYQWQFRYNIGSTSAYKWEFIGGTQVRSAPGGTLNVTNTTPTAIPSGPTFTIPRSGDYDLRFGCQLQNTAGFAGAYNAYAQLAAAGTMIGLVATFIPTATFAGAAVVSAAYNTLTAGQVIDMRCSNSTASGPTTSCGNAWLEITPRRIS